MHPIGKAITHDDTQTFQLDIQDIDYATVWIGLAAPGPRGNLLK
jgi:hypothetical protein